MQDRVDTDLNKFFNREDKKDMDQENFMSDAEPHFNTIEETVFRLETISEDYPIELKDVIINHILDILIDRFETKKETR